MPQLLLFPDPRPLVERLGRDFFRQLPETAGVYLMRDAGGNVLYVGKARNLRRRLCSYRVANPDRMARRHLRLLRAVAAIELEACADEAAALKRESELLRALKPRFNRAGTWPAPGRYVSWRGVGGKIELTVTGEVADGWQGAGPFGGGAFIIRAVLARLLWLAVNDQRCPADLPAGWLHGSFPEPTAVYTGAQAEEAVRHLSRFFAGASESFLDWAVSRNTAARHAIWSAVIQADVEECQKFKLSLARAVSARGPKLGLCAPP